MGKITIKNISKELDIKARPGSSVRSSLSDENIGEFYNISLDKIIPYRNQARVLFDIDELNSLAETIKKHGVRQPLTVILNENGLYEVVSGERRLRAAKIAGINRVPCIILKDKSQAEDLAIIENIQRKDLHPLELASALQKLINKGYTQKQISENLSLGKSYVSEILKLNELDEETKKVVLENNITSRDVMRNLSHGNQSLSDLKKLSSSQSNSSYPRSKSVFRVAMMNGEYIVQKNFLSKLTMDQKKSLRKELNFIIRDYLS